MAKAVLASELETSDGIDVRIGKDVEIQPGITIGEQSIIGAGSIVRKNVPPFKMVIGSPARVVYEIRGDSIVKCKDCGF